MSSASEYRYPGLGIRSGMVLCDRRLYPLDSCRCQDYANLEQLLDDMFFGDYRSGTATGSQVAQTGSGSGVERFVASGSGSQVASTGSGDGTVKEGPPVPVPVVPEVVPVGTGGKGYRIPILPWRLSPPKKRQPKLPEEPQVVCFGTGGGAQSVQIGDGNGRIGTSGRSRSGQAKHAAESRGTVRMGGVGHSVQNDKRIEIAIARRRRDEEILIQLLLRAA